MKLILRGHHLLCLKGFQGYGYDENFTRNMTDVNLKRKLKTTTVTLVNSPDDICRDCPNLKDNLCEDKAQNDKIVLMDNEILSKIDPTKNYNSIELFEKIDEIFSTEKSVSKICGECMWHEECLFYQKLSKNR